MSEWYDVCQKCNGWTDGQPIFGYGPNRQGPFALCLRCVGKVQMRSQLTMTKEQAANAIVTALLPEQREEALKEEMGTQWEIEGSAARWGGGVELAQWTTDYRRNDE